MNFKKISIKAFGRYVPPRVLTNDELGEMVDTDDEWIYSHTGIRKRHISTGENTSDLCTKAARQALQHAGVAPEDVDIIIVTTSTPDYALPSTACLVQSGLGARKAFAFDISAACAGFIYALSVAEKMLRSPHYRNALVISGDVLSKIVDWSDRKTCVIFGDGSGAVLLSAAESYTDESFLISEDIHSNGDKAMSLFCGYKGVSNPFCAYEPGEGDKFINMDGRAIFDFVTRQIPISVNAALEKAKLGLNDIKLVVPHQANARIVEVVAKRMSCGMDKFALNIERYGNTSAASMPIAICELLETGRISLGSGDKYVLTGFGSGLTWGSLVIAM
ncbi:MAG: ketoacyl-ACP synthase III [Defluviitaleaceae bacterium]|nr:ketoacyl-ACP synthase III [Defluviitaleaceae bacterium]